MLPFITAFKNKDYDIHKMTAEWATLLNHQKYKNVKDFSGRTPLDYGLENPSFMKTIEIDTLKFLMPEKIEKLTNKMYLGVEYAAKNKDPNVRMLLKTKFDMQLNLFECIMHSGDVIKAQKLIDDGANINCQYPTIKKKMQPLLHFVIQDCTKKELCKFLLENNADVFLQNETGNSALHALLQIDSKPDKEILNLIRKLGGKNILNQKNWIDKDTPLMLSLTNPYVDNKIIQSLISNLNPDMSNADKQYPIHMAVKISEIKFLQPYAYQITEELLQVLNYQQHKNDRDWKSMTPLYYALGNENLIQKINIIKMLISKENIHFKSWNEDYPIHVATANMFVTTEIIDLLDYEKYKNTPNRDGNTPLHRALKYNSKNVNVIEKLISKKNVNMKNNCDDYPLHTALLNKNRISTRVIKSLLTIENCNKESLSVTPSTFVKLRLNENPEQKAILNLIVDYISQN
jgi:ankyrin repeat protein